MNLSMLKGYLLKPHEIEISGHKNYKQGEIYLSNWILSSLISIDKVLYVPGIYKSLKTNQIFRVILCN